MGAPGSEFDNRSSVCRLRYARRFTGDHGLKIDCGQQKRLHNLRFDNGRGDAQDRFARGKYGAFRHRPHIAGKMELREVVEKIAARVSEHRQFPRIRDFLVRKSDVFQKIERLIEAGGSQIVSSRRERTHEQFKRGSGVETCFEVARRHGQLVQVGQKTGILGAGSHPMSAVNYAIGLQSGASKVKLSSYLGNRFIAAFSARKISHDDAPTARSVLARVKFSQFQSVRRPRGAPVQLHIRPARGRSAPRVQCPPGGRT